MIGTLFPELAGLVAQVKTNRCDIILYNIILYYIILYLLHTELAGLVAQVKTNRCVKYIYIISYILQTEFLNQFF